MSDVPSMTADPTAAPAGTPVDASPARRSLYGEPVLRFVLVLVAYAVIIATSSALVVAKQLPYSIFDEATHVDYAYSIAHGHVPAAGSTISPQIRAEWSCFGEANAKLPACGTVAPPSSYPARGENYNFFHPPLYYAITGLIARAADGLFGSGGFTTAARSVGLGWLLAGAAVLYLALRRFRVHWFVAATTGALALLWLPFSSAASYVSNDAVAFLSGALALFALARIVVDKNVGWVLPGVLALLASATKTLNAMPFLAIAGLFIVLAVFPRINRSGLSWRRLLAIAGSIVVGVLVPYGGWTVFQAHRGVSDWVSPVAGVSTIDFTHDVAVSWLSADGHFLFAPFSTGHLDAALNTYALVAVFQLLAVFVLAAPVLVFGVRRLAPAGALVAGAAVIGLIAMPFFVEVQEYLGSHGTQFFANVNPRYSLAVQPLFFGAVALAVTHFRLRHPLWIATVMIYGATIYSLATARR